MELHKSNFLAITEMPEIQGIKIQWLAASERMTDEEFQTEILGEKKAIETKKPKNIFADTLQMKFSIPPNLQEWHNNLIFPVFKSAEVKRLAILVSTDIFAQVSIEQLVEDGSEKEFVTKYFDTEKELISWLKS